MRIDTATVAALTIVSAAVARGGEQAPYRLPEWFEANRVQAHSEHPLELALRLTPEGHAAAIRRLGAEVLTRIYLNRDEGAWWQSTVGEINPLIGDREFAAEISRAVHQQGMKVIAYHRHMSDAAMQREHPDWVCHHPDGSPMLEPRGKKKTIFVLCMNSPYHEYIKTRLVELADRGVDAIYFDNRHMPDICTCRYCLEAFRKEMGHEMDPMAPVGSPGYREAVEFVNRSMVRGFLEWREAVRRGHPEVFFSVKSSQYPMFFSPHIDYNLLAISDTSGTEFHKPFGHRTTVMRDEPDFAEPAFDDQLALGWSVVRDCAAGRPPLMWIPFIREEEKSLYSATAAITYGCVAAMNITIRDLEEDASRNEQVFPSTFEMGKAISPYLKYSRPIRFAGLWISERSRNARLGDLKTMWREVFSPALGACQVLREEHIPWGTVNDGEMENADLEDGPLAGTRLLVLPWPDELTAGQQETVRRFEQSGRCVVRLDPRAGWHSLNKKPALVEQMLKTIRDRAPRPPVRISGPKAMHAVCYDNPQAHRVTVCLANSFGWFHSSRNPDPEATASEMAPPPCSGVAVEFSRDLGTPKRVFDALGGKDLAPVAGAGGYRAKVPEFRIGAFVVAEY